jgi:two-component system chemotaxis family response regulator WspR
MQLAVEITETMRSDRLPHQGNPVGIATVSIGFATMTPAFGLHATNQIERADQALYLAKRTERNRVCNGNNVAEGGAGADSKIWKSA